MLGFCRAAMVFGVGKVKPNATTFRTAETYIPFGGPFTDMMKLGSELLFARVDGG
jgi:hypothetical protein